MTGHKIVIVGQSMGGLADPVPCSCTSLPHDPVILAAVLAAIRSNVTPP